jgi:UDP-glucose 4-epimerase
LFAADCGELVADSLARLRLESASQGPHCHVKVLASQQGVTVGFLLSELRRVFKRAPKIVYGSSATSKFQVRDLRLRSEVWADVDRRALTPLPAGIKQTVQGLLGSLQAGRLA